MADTRNPKRYKTLFSWFNSGTSSIDKDKNEQYEGAEIRDEQEGPVILDEEDEGAEIRDEQEGPVILDKEDEGVDIGDKQDEGADIDDGVGIDEGTDIRNEQDEGADIGNEQDERADGEIDQERVQEFEDYDITSLERDPGIRPPIGTYPLNERDNVRRAYVVYGPNQPYLAEYPSTKDGIQGRRFCRKWFKEWHWLEYSLNKDKAYCFPCFLFDGYPSQHPSFTEVGFNGWKNVMSKHSGILFHVGGVMSLHNANVHKWENLRNPSRHIERVISRLSSQEIARNRLRLVATIEVVRLLARQGCSFRGHDESVSSLNGGNFDAVLDSFRGLNNEIKMVTDYGPGNAKYTSPKIQKKIANILANKVRAMIRDEIGDAKFAILVDEALDVSNKEQMAIILRFPDRKGILRERFFKVVKVTNTCSQTLKDEILKAFTEYNLQLENIRGQGYDGANNMSGQFNGLQALFQRECPYAYYVHCFAHRLQLSLNVVAKGVPEVWQFFSSLTMISNFVESSAKRHSMLKSHREEEISELVAAGTLNTGTGKNQATTLQRAGATRWGSHLRSISSLIKLFTSTRSTIDDLYITGVDKVQGEAKAVGKALKKFDFVYCLHMMHDIMKITDFLCQVLQRKDIDILNALHSLAIAKEKLQDMRENGWDNLIEKVKAFCSEHDICMPDLSAPYKKGLRSCETGITNEQHYRFNILNGVIDFQVEELNARFTDSSKEILTLGASFDPRHNFRAFKSEDVCKLVVKYYPLDFSSNDMRALDLECGFFVADVQKDPRFENMTSISDLCRRLVEFDKNCLYPMIYRLICLLLTLPVSTATTERAFSSMKIIKNKLRNKMNDEFLDDLMVLYIERTFAGTINNDDVIAEFELSGTRRVKFS